MAEPTLPAARYEQSDVSFRFLLLGAGVVLGTILLCAVGVMWLYPGALHDRRLATVLPVDPEPRLQTNPAEDLRRFRAQELLRLNSVGWVDQSHGIVHIPVDEAMRRIAVQGIPDWPVSAGTKR